MFLSLLFGVFVCFCIPLGILIHEILQRKNGSLRAFFAGCGCFFLMQVCIRIPLLQNVLPRQAWFLALSLHPYAYGLFLALTAGLFEEIGRWTFMRLFLDKHRTFSAGFVFGAGHGGIEAVLFTGLGLASHLIGGLDSSVMLNSGLIIAAGIERLFAMVFHIATSLIVMYGLKNQRSVICLPLAVLLHTLLDLLAVYGQYAGMQVSVMETLFAILSLLSLGFTILIWRKK